MKIIKLLYWFNIKIKNNNLTENNNKNDNNKKDNKN